VVFLFFRKFNYQTTVEISAMKEALTVLCLAVSFGGAAARPTCREGKFAVEFLRTGSVNP
jgi:hypothetical protein